MNAGAREYTPGERIPGTVYEVVRRLGSGGMGTVYDVEDTTVGRRYVLKALHPRFGGREDLTRRIQNEARTLARLHHPNIVEVFTAGVTGDDLRLPFYVMEKLDGQSLRLVLEKKGQLELSHAYHIAIDLLDALDHAHDKGVIHRDVKPDNIYLHRTSAGVTVTKLLDFGIVSLISAGTARDTAGRFVGTLRYAAPEQLRGEGPTPKMDVYCAALVLYEMVAGRGPFDDQGDSKEIAAAHLHRPAPPITQFVIVPRELETLLAAALAKRPEGRPRDAFSFAASLRNLKRSLSVDAAAHSTNSRATARVLVDPSATMTVPTTPSPPPVPTLPMQAPDFAPSATASGPPEVDRAAVDRAAVTHTADPPEAPRPAPEGATERMDRHAERDTPPDGVAAIRWPPERPPVSSEGQQAHTLSARPAQAAWGPSRAAIAMVVSTTLGLAATIAVIAGMRHRVAERAPSEVHATPATASVAPLPPPPSPVVVPPAPTLAPPALDDGLAPASPSAGAATPPPQPSQRVRAASPRPRPAAAARPSTPPPDRPGPGF